MDININLDLSRLQIPEVIVMAIAGLLLLFFGYRIKKVGFFIIWFLIGFNLMRILMPWINSVAGPAVAESDLWQMLLPIAGGLLLAMLGFSIEKICVAGMVFGIVLMLTTQYFGTEIQTLVIGAIIGVVLAGFAVTMMKPTIIIATALMGAYTLALAIFKFSAVDPKVFYFPIIIILTAVGSVVQFVTTKHID